MSKIQDNTSDKNTIEQNQEAQAKAIANLLDQKANRLSMRAFKQLETAREKAVARHQALTTGQTGQSVNADGTLSAWFAWTHQTRMIGIGLFCVALITGVMLTKQFNATNQDSDAFLLGSELPPEAFVDRGFEPWLNAKADI